MFQCHFQCLLDSNANDSENEKGLVTLRTMIMFVNIKILNTNVLNFF